MIPAVLTAMAQSQAGVMVPALEQELKELQTAGADVTAHMAALTNFQTSLAQLAQTFQTMPAKPTA